MVQASGVDKWGRVVEVIENKNKVGLGFQQGPFKDDVKAMQSIFHSGWFTHKDERHSVAIIEDEEACANFVPRGQTCNNWVIIYIPVIVHHSK